MNAPRLAQESVLATLDRDGHRRWLRPVLANGRWHRLRRAVAWLLVLVFVGLPFVRVDGKPAFLLDIVHRRFTVFGATLLATDAVLLMLVGLGVGLGVFLVSARLGRAWCGWACPQTVYLEFLFRPIERLFEGGHGRRTSLGRRVGKFAVFALLATAVAHVFLAWFVGTEALLQWLQGSPAQHPVGFAVMAGTSVLAFLDFAWFREQMCTVACPYARLQAVLLDRRSTLVAYDRARGEPRGKFPNGNDLSRGDCIDCRACVRACPTGIDIRDGVQMECIACTQCIDACDAIMDRVQRPRGLVRYTSLDALAGKAAPRVQWRLVLYPLALLAVLGSLVWLLVGRPPADVTVLRGHGAPFQVLADGSVSNQVRLRIQHRGDRPARYRLSLVGMPQARLVAPENPLRVAAGALAQTSVFIQAPARARTRAVVRIDDGAGFTTDVPVTLLGPDSPDEKRR